MQSGHKWVLGFSCMYLLLSAIYFFMTWNVEFLLYVAVVLLVGGVIFATRNTSGITSFGLWLLSIWGLLHMLGGLVVIGDTVLYGLKLYPFIDNGGDFYILRMDQVIHFYGFFSAAVVMFQLLQKRVRKEVHVGMLIFIATVSSMGLGALNEVIEFIAWLSIENTGVGDMYNLGFDLVSNLFGALVGSFVEAFRRKSIK